MGAITRNAANNITTGGVILPAGINDTSVASISELEQVATGGGLNLISSQTASASASIEFTTGLDSTYDIYKFEFINIQNTADGEKFGFNLSTDGGSNYNVTKTSSAFRAYHLESGSESALQYYALDDLAQGTGLQTLAHGMGSDSDEGIGGYMYLFAPSSSTYVKHFIATVQNNAFVAYAQNHIAAGYGNTTSAINAIIFQANTGNINGTIRMYGIKSS